MKISMHTLQSLLLFWTVIVGKVSIALAFTTVTGTTTTTTNNNNNSKNHHQSQPAPSSTEVACRNIAGSFIAVSTILSNVLIMAPEASYASTTTTNVMMESTTQLLAARSGGRAGGRAASSSRSVSRPSSSSSSPTVIQRRTTVIQQPVYTSPNVIVSPGYGYGGGFYSPPPSGLGLAIGLNAISGIGEGLREARQENEIRSTRDQLNDARVREAEMAVKIQQLEQMQQLQQQQLMAK